MVFISRSGFLSLLMFWLVVVTTGCSSDDKIVTVEPKEIDSFLLNPGRGFTSTGNTYNENIGSRLHPLCGVTQQRFFWDKLEPEEGKINYDLIDSAIAKAV